MQIIYARAEQYFPYKSNERHVLLVMEVQYAFREVGVTF